MIRFLLLSILIPWTSAFCQSYSAKTTIDFRDTLKLTGRDSATILLDQALSLMKKNYYGKNGVAWDNLVVEAKRKLSSAVTCQDAYSILSSCFEEMRADHSFIMPPANSAVYANDTAQLHRIPLMREWMGEIKFGFHDPGIAYLSVPWVGTTDPAICTKIADSLQKIISILDRTGISKWIIDLRSNRGGNCWPMLSGIGPLLGSDTCGYFVLSSTKKAIRYKDGNAMNGDNIICGLSRSAYTTKIVKKNIAVLIGPETSSSGEIVSLAFKGSLNTMLFGEPTAGLTTANMTYNLLDRSMLVLSVYGEADRNGRICEGKIQPDEYISAEPTFPLNDPAMNAATMWLQSL